MFFTLHARRPEIARRDATIMAASAKAARRLGLNDTANLCEVLINLVNANKRKALKLQRPRTPGKPRLDQKVRGPFEPLILRLDTPVRPPGKRDCLSRLRSDKSAELSNPVVSRD